jgi:cytochrome c553
MLVLVPAGAAAQNLSPTAVASSEKVQYNWVMHCQGCHGAEADGSPGRVPPLRGNVARFLHATAGRAYLARVPGVAFADLSDVEVAQLLNWLVRRFDRTHVPKTFTPYSAEEIQKLRGQPLISDAYYERRRILLSMAPRS